MIVFDRLVALHFDSFLIFSYTMSIFLALHHQAQKHCHMGKTPIAIMHSSSFSSDDVFLGCVFLRSQVQVSLV